MAVQVGVRLGHDEIVELIELGGTGEVYRARDPRLQRDVAIKILPSQVDARGLRLQSYGARE